MQFQHTKGIPKHEIYGFGADAYTQRSPILDAQSETRAPVFKVHTIKSDVANKAILHLDDPRIIMVD
jgi:hypothetical protein